MKFNVSFELTADEVASLLLYCNFAFRLELRKNKDYCKKEAKKVLKEYGKTYLDIPLPWNEYDLKEDLTVEQEEWCKWAVVQKWGS